MSDDNSLSISPEIAEYYAQGGEAGRLFRGRGQLELTRTQEILRRHLPPPPAVVLDVGGATGVYAYWLAGLGYEVHLVDPVPSHIEAARLASKHQPSGPLASANVGDARRLSHPTNGADVVLLLGPLYHLTQQADRMQALREARRVLRPGGLLCAIGISKYAPLLDGLFRGLLKDPEFGRIVDRVLQTGEQTDPTGRGYFTTAYMHHPDEFEREIRAAGFAIEEFAAIEGVAASLPDFNEWWDDPQRREWLLAVTRTAEHDRSLFGAGAHFLLVGSKTRGRPAHR